MGLTFANKVTICRIITVPFFIGTILYYSPERDILRYIGLGIFCFAVLLDVIDGYIARRLHQKTRAGAILDPLADKVLLISSFICLFKVGAHFDIRFPIWLVVAVISRDVILLLGSMLIYIIHGELNVEPSRWGKASTFFQVLSVISMLIQFQASVYIWYITILFTVISGLGYIRNGIKVLNIYGNEGK
jgi:CDP-diacylglycerol--glycerol-3-phosphate 3-phosphatidyltransferase